MNYREYDDFLLLIKQKDLEGIRKCVSDHSYDLNSSPGNAATALCYAVRCGNDTVLKLLLELGADPNVNFESSLSPLMESALYLGGNLFKKLDLEEIATQKMEYLSLQNALLTEINYAGSLNTLAKLKVMDLRGNKLKKSALKELRSLLPSCIIIENDAEMEKQAGVVKAYLP